MTITRGVLERVPEDKNDGKPHVSEDPRQVALSDSVFCHLAHHRGQLTVYLRQNGAAVPMVYGPTADEGWRK